jgi:antirestriction protein
MNTISSLSAHSDNKVAFVNEITGRSFPTKDEILEHKHSLDSDNPAVYCGTYGKYNSGSLEGMWIDLTTFFDYDDFIEFCYNLHADEEDPELMFQDYENFPRELYSESCFNEDEFDTIIKYANLSDRDAVDAFISCFCVDELDNFEEYYVGYFDSEEDFARHIVEECYDLDKMLGSLSSYFDYSSFADDLFMCDYFFDNGYVFRR